MNMSVDSFHDWVPAFFSGPKAAPIVDWCYLGNERFIQPFFEDTIQQRMRLPFNSLFRKQTSIDFLGEVVSASAVIPPTGFIFHMSRCGSTLVAQLLAALEKNTVISEPPLIDWIIGSTNGSVTEETKKQWLQWTVGTLGRARSGREENYFVKFDSWNTLDLDLISSVFPSVPFIFLYRDPLEVLVSQVSQPGLHAVRGALGKRVCDLPLEAALKLSQEEYIARVLAAVCSAGLRHANDERMLLINYNQLPDAIFDSIANHFHVSFSREEIERMTDKTAYHAKTPQLSFTPDSERKKREASDEARRTAAEWLDPIYEQLEKRRQQ